MQNEKKLTHEKAGTRCELHVPAALEKFFINEPLTVQPPKETKTSEVKTNA